MRIVIPDKLDISEADRRVLEKYPDIEIFDDVDNNPAVIIERIKNMPI
jgi:hypothetical protein